MGGRVLVYKQIGQFLGVASGRPPVFTDNDGTWYVARDAGTVTRMTYVIKHVRFLQELCEGADAELLAKQCDTALNFTDPLSKYTDAATRVRHFLFMMGYPEKAIERWQEQGKAT